MSPRQGVVVLEEGYSAEFPSVASILKSVAKRGRGVGVCLVSVFHHLSDVSPDSPLASLIREAGVNHLLRQAQLEQAEHTAKLLGVVNLTGAIQKLNKGEHILLEGGQPEVRPPRVVCHVRTDLDRWTNYTDSATTGGTDAPPSPFPEDRPALDDAVVGAFAPAPEDMAVETFDAALRAAQWLSDAGHTDDGGIQGQDFWDGLASRMIRPAAVPGRAAQLHPRRRLRLDPDRRRRLRHHPAGPTGQQAGDPCLAVPPHHPREDEVLDRRHGLRHLRGLVLRRDGQGREQL